MCYSYVNLLTPSSISLSLDQMYHFLSTSLLDLCMLRLQLISLSLSVFLVTSRALFIMAFFSKDIKYFGLLLLPMLIGPATMMTAHVSQPTLSILVAMRSCDVQRNKTLLQDHQRKLNIGLSPLVLLKFFGLKISYKNQKFHVLLFLKFFVITLAPHTSLSIPSSILV